MKDLDSAPYTWEELANPRVVKQLLEENEIHARKYLGQNFLIDANIIRKILDAARPGPDDLVVEIGPGLGSMTIALSERCGLVFALEKDPRLVRLLNELLIDRESIEIEEGDAVSFDFEQAWSDVGPETRVITVSNLPYSMAQTILVRLMQSCPRIEECTLMVQKEVGERLLAEPDSREYGVTTVKVRWRAEVSNLGKVSRNCFLPRPRVDSMLLRVARRKGHLPAIPDEETFDRVVDAAFRQRRKTIVKSLATAPGLGLDRKEIEGALSASGISPRARAEDLSPEDFAHIAQALREAGTGAKA